MLPRTRKLLPSTAQDWQLVCWRVQSTTTQSLQQIQVLPAATAALIRSFSAAAAAFPSADAAYRRAALLAAASSAFFCVASVSSSSRSTGLSAATGIDHCDSCGFHRPPTSLRRSLTLKVFPPTRTPASTTVKERAGILCVGDLCKMGRVDSIFIATKWVKTSGDKIGTKFMITKRRSYSFSFCFDYTQSL